MAEDFLQAGDEQGFSRRDFAFFAVKADFEKVAAAMQAQGWV